MTKIWIDKVILNWLKVKSEKNIGVLFKVSLHLIRHAYQYFSRLYEYKYVSYISYGNTAWVNTSQIKFKEILAKHQHVVPIIFQEEKKGYARPFLKKNHALNVYQKISYKFLHLSALRNWT